MGQIDFKEDSSYYRGKRTVNLKKVTTNNNYDIENCKVDLNPNKLVSNECTLAFFEKWGGGSQPTYEFDWGNFGFNSNIQNVGGSMQTSPFEEIADWVEELDPVTGNESLSGLPNISIIDTVGSILSSGACGMCDSTSNQVSFKSTNNVPSLSSYKADILVGTQNLICLNGDSYLSEINFSQNTIISLQLYGLFGQSAGQPLGYQRWISMTVSGQISLGQNDNPLRKFCVSPTIQYLQYNFNGNRNETRDPSTIADIPDQICVRLRSSPV